jgi:uncharacterized protein
VKILLWLTVAIIVVFWLVRSKNTTKTKNVFRPKADNNATATDTEPMIECAYCGVHIPVSESVVAPSGAVFCSEEHRRLRS